MTKHFFDVGSNTGTTFDWLATQPHDYSDHIIWCIDPSPRHFAALRERCERERKYRIRICSFGLGGETGVFEVYEKDDPQGDSFHAWTKSDHVPANRLMPVPVYAASFGATHFIDSVTNEGDEIVLDIDAEGAEYEILRDILATGEHLLSRIKRVMVEFHFTKSEDDCAESKAALMAEFAACGITIEVRGSVP